MREPSHADIISRISALETDMRTVKKMQEETRIDVKAIRSAVDEGRGGWRIAMALGIPAAIGGGIVLALQNMFGKH